MASNECGAVGATNGRDWQPASPGYTPLSLPPSPSHGPHCAVDTTNERDWQPPSPGYTPLSLPPSPSHSPTYLPTSPDYIPLGPPSPPCRIQPCASPRRIPTYLTLHVPEFTSPRHSSEHLTPSPPDSSMHSGHPILGTDDQEYVQVDELDYEPRADDEAYKDTGRKLLNAFPEAHGPHQLSLEKQHARLMNTVFPGTKEERLAEPIAGEHGQRTCRNEFEDTKSAVAGSGAPSRHQHVYPDDNWRNNNFYKTNKHLFDWLLMDKDQRAALASTSNSTSKKNSQHKKKVPATAFNASNDIAIVLSDDDVDTQEENADNDF